jgi:hypothetical protein
MKKPNMTIRVAIIGAAASGKTHFLERVLIPALAAQRDFSFEWEDGGGFSGGVVHRPQPTRKPYEKKVTLRNPARLEIRAFQSPEFAAKWLRGSK